MVRRQGPPVAEPGRPKKWIETAEGWARANLLVEKSSYLPPVGSLKEALFLTVWLKRSEAEALKTRIMAQGLIDASEKGSKATADLYVDYINAAMPFLSKTKVSKDEELKRVMQREVGKGAIVFNTPTTPNPLVQRAKQMSLPDDFRQKLANRKKRTA